MQVRSARLLPHTGELAAVATAVCWTLTALSFEVAGRRIGSLSVNLVRLVLASGLLAAFGAAARGLPLPIDATPHQWAWLSLSALLGLVFGDLCLFRAFVVLGPRLAALIMAAAPVWTALFGYFALGESLRVVDGLGMALVIGGIAWAVAERRGTGGRPTGTGVWLALGGSVGQASGLVLSKYGMEDYDAFAATHIRVLVGAAGFVVVCTLARWWPRVRVALADRRAMQMTALGAVFGPFLGVGLSLFAVQHSANTGVAAAIMATTPILLIPAVALRGERVGAGGIGGAALAVAGVALLFVT